MSADATKSASQYSLGISSSRTHVRMPWFSSPLVYRLRSSQQQNNLYLTLFDPHDHGGAAITWVIPFKLVDFDSALISGGTAILICGGSPNRYSTDSSKVTFTYDLGKKSLIPRADMLQPNHWHTVVAVLGRVVYSIGGHRQIGGVHNECEAYCCATDRWRTAPKLTEKKCLVGACVLDERFVYVFGGEFGQGYLNTIERLDTLEESAGWTAVPYSGRDLVARRSPCMIQVGVERMLVMGGAHTEGFQVVSLRRGQAWVQRECEGKEREYYERKPTRERGVIRVYSHVPVDPQAERLIKLDIRSYCLQKL